MILLIAGTRPELIKLSPVYREVTRQLREAVDINTETKLLCVQQQKNLVAQHLEGFHDADVEHLPLGDEADARGADGLDTLYPRLLRAMDQWFSEYRGGMVDKGRHGHTAVVQGDTLTALAGATVAKAHGWIVVHVEAGLRSPRVDSPYPEEWTRRAIARLADVHCAPTVLAEMNLHSEQVTGLILRTGNTGVDALRQALGTLRPQYLKDRKPKILITCHRREAWNQILPELIAAVAEMAEQHPDWIFVWPLHPNPLIAKLTEPLSAFSNVLRVRALTRSEFVQEMVQARVIITDSGGVIEDAVTLGRRTCVVRAETEREEAFDGDPMRVQLIPPGRVRVLPSIVPHMLAADLEQPMQPSFVFGDGWASQRIANLLLGMRPCHA